MKTQNTVTEKRVSPRKAADKPVAKVESKPRKAVTLVSGKVTPLAVAAGAIRKFHVFIESARPSDGPRLAAHTNAVLLFLGLGEKQPAKKKAVVALLGTRAVQYHRGIGNFEQKADCLSLTKKGLDFFKTRIEAGKVDGDLSTAFLAAIRHGRANQAAQIRQDDLAPVSMPIR